MTGQTLLLVAALVIILPLALAAPIPFQTSSDTTLAIEYPKIESLQAGLPAELNTHVFDPDGVPVDNTTITCHLELYLKNGTEALQEPLGFGTDEWELTLGAGNFSTIGKYPYLIYCYNTTIGGFVSGTIEVTTDGVVENDGYQWLLLSLLPLIFGLLIVLGARLFDPAEHWVLHAASFLLGLVSTFVSTWFAALAVVKFTEWGEMQGALSTWTLVSGIMIAVFGAYWLIYIFYRLVKIAAMKKERRLDE